MRLVVVEHSGHPPRMDRTQASQPLTQLALSKHPDMPTVPLIIDLAQTDEQRNILRLVFARQQIAYSVPGAARSPSRPRRGAALRIPQGDGRPRTSRRRPQSKARNIAGRGRRRAKAGGRALCNACGGCRQSDGNAQIAGQHRTRATRNCALATHWKVSDMGMLSRRIRSVHVLFALTLASTPASAQTPADFYKGKTIEVYIGTSAGGGYDAYSRILSRHMGRTFRAIRSWCRRT